MTKPCKLLVAAILGAHGIQGQVRVRSFTEDPESLFAFKTLTDEPGQQEFALKLKGVGKDHFIASIKGVTDRDSAEALRGTQLFIDRSALPKTGKNEYYEADLIDLNVITTDGKHLGQVKALHDYGAGAFLEIQPFKGTGFMLPFNDAFVPEVDLKAGRLAAIVPEGWLDEPKPKKEKRP